MGDETVAVQMENLTIDEVKKEKVVEMDEESDEVCAPEVDTDNLKGQHKQHTEQVVEEVGESQPSQSRSPEINSNTPDPSPVFRPMSPTSSMARSEYSVVAASEPPMPRDRNHDYDDEVIAPSTPRSSVSGRSTPRKSSALAEKFMAAANGKDSATSAERSSRTATSTQVRNLASSFGTDAAAQQEKQRKLDQLRGGKFKTPSKKWGQVGSVSMKMTRVDEEGDSKSEKTGQEEVAGPVSSVLAMRKNWELGKASTFNDRGTTVKEQEKKEKGFGDLMNRFKVFEGSEKSTTQKTKESRSGITSKAAMFETNIKKPGKSTIPKPGVKATTGKPSKAAGEEGEPAPNSIRGRAAMFEKK